VLQLSPRSPACRQVCGQGGMPRVGRCVWW